MAHITVRFLVRKQREYDALRDAIEQLKAAVGEDPADFGVR